mmetsp:Transcript_24438/g.48075  ORF Transcript_24438/g.48075 Transcript_24438/m.48075 type:complete len:206 (-) Transcript_24438:1429-2046(-)
MLADYSLKQGGAVSSSSIFHRCFHHYGCCCCRHLGQLRFATSCAAVSAAAVPWKQTPHQKLLCLLLHLLHLLFRLFRLFLLLVLRRLLLWLLLLEGEIVLELLLLLLLLMKMMRRMMMMVVMIFWGSFLQFGLVFDWRIEIISENRRRRRSVFFTVLRKHNIHSVEASDLLRTQARQVFVSFEEAVGIFDSKSTQLSELVVEDTF